MDGGRWRSTVGGGECREVGVLWGGGFGGRLLLGTDPVFPPSVHIQANLEDSLVQEALKTVSCPPPPFPEAGAQLNPPSPGDSPLSPQGMDLRQYSKQVELELQHIEHASIRDCILPHGVPPRAHSPGTVWVGADGGRLGGGLRVRGRSLHPGCTAVPLHILGCLPPHQQRGVLRGKPFPRRKRKMAPTQGLSRAFPPPPGWLGPPVPSAYFLSSLRAL